MSRGPAREDLLVLEAAGMFPLLSWRLSMSRQDWGDRSLGLGEGGYLALPVLHPKSGGTCDSGSPATRC